MLRHGNSRSEVRLAATPETGARRRAIGLTVRVSIGGMPARTIVRSAEFKGAARLGSRATTAIRASEQDERSLRVAAGAYPAAAGARPTAAAGDIRRWM